MKIYCKSNLTPEDRELNKKAREIAKRLHDVEDRLDPYASCYEEIPSVNTTARNIVKEVRSGRKEVTLDDPVSYNVREALKDWKAPGCQLDDPDCVAMINEYEDVYNDLLRLRGIRS